MPTSLQNVLDRITLDYLNRTDLNAVTIRAIQAAVRHYERKRWPWNQTVTTLTAATSVTTLTVPDDFLILDRLEIQFQGGSFELNPRSFDEIREMNNFATPANLPTDFNLRGTSFELAPPPDSAYLLNCYYIKQLPALTATELTGSNDWLSAAEDLIVYHATKLIWANVLRNNEEATKYAQLEHASFLELGGYRDQQTITKIRPTQF